MKTLLYVLAGLSVAVAPAAHAERLPLTTQKISVDLPEGDISVSKNPGLDAILVSIEPSSKNGCTPTIERDARGYKFGYDRALWQMLRGVSCRALVRIETPRDLDLNLSVTAGSITVDAVSGNHDLQGTSTEFAVSHLQGRTLIEATNARVAAADLAGALAVSSTNGKIELTQSPSEVAYVTHGMITSIRPRGLPKTQVLKAPRLSVDLDTVTGSITFRK